MSDVLIPFALHKPTGEQVFVDDVPRGLACECECIGCGERLVARKGQNRHHFAHRAKKINDEEPCPFSFDRAVFWMCREVFRTATSFAVPAYHVKFKHHKLTHEYAAVAAQPNTVAIGGVLFPEPLLSSYKGDLVILNVQDHYIAVAINERTPWLPTWPGKKAFRYKDKEIAHIHLDVNAAIKAVRHQKSQFRQSMEDVLLNSIDAKTWLYHPREEKHRDTYRSQIPALLAEQDELEKQRKERLAVQEQRRAAIENARMLVEQSKHWQTKEIQKRRLKQLLDQLFAFRDLGYTQGKVCERCYFISEIETDQCGYCQHTEFNKVELTPDYFHCIDKKYDQKGFVRRSLAGMPPLEDGSEDDAEPEVEH